MGALAEIAQVYSDVLDPFHALLFFLIGAAVYFAKGTGRRGMAARVGALVVLYVAAGVSAVLVYDSFQSPPEYMFDLVASAGAFLGLGAISVVWYVRGWEQDFIVMTVFLVVVTIVFAAVSPFWNMSGHVSLIAAPCVYLALVNRRAIALVVIPLLMIPSRVLVNEHTLLQAVTALAVVVTLGLLYHQYAQDTVRGLLS